MTTPEKAKFYAAQANILALGGPGSGKTHAALVKANEFIASGALRPAQKVVFLSFARPTVARVLEKAVQVVGAVALEHLEVNTYHSFAWNILRSHGYVLNGKSVVELMPPPQAAAHLARIPAAAREAEKVRLFEEEGRLHFDLFAGLLARLFKQAPSLRNIYADSYPLIILDEFQDTSADEWEMVQELGVGSRLIALADPDQRIYEFRGADPKRLDDFAAKFRPEVCDFSGENYRSAGTDIATYGADLLTGENKLKQYTNVFVVGYPSRKAPHNHLRLKLEILSALGRLSKKPISSIAVLVPSRALMMQVSEALSTNADGRPALGHDVALDSEPPALAALAIAAILDTSSPATRADRLLVALIEHILGRRGTRPVPQADITFANALNSFRATGRAGGARRKLSIDECARIATEVLQLELSGGPGEDWLTVRSLFEASTCDRLRTIASDARYLRLLRRGAALRTSLGELWRQQGTYQGAIDAVKDALLQEHFALAQQEQRGIKLMTIHKSKGKEFDEVIIYDGAFQRILRDAANPSGVAQDRLALRVAVTRAMSRATILTPSNDRCPFL